MQCVMKWVLNEYIPQKKGMNEMDCIYWIDDGSEHGKCSLNGCTCSENDCELAEDIDNLWGLI